MRPTHHMTRTDRARVRMISGRIRARRKKVTSPLRRGVLLAPATITSIGLLSGFYSAISSIQGHFEQAALMIMIAFICDGLDGRIARLSRSASQFGIEYDSLSDVVAFGMAPAILAFTWALHPIGGLGVAVSGLFVVCAALRLARFNVQTASVDKRRFVGLPVPGAAALVAGIALAYSYFEFSSPRTLCTVMVPITLALAGLMISRVPYPSFKGINLHRRARIELMVAAIAVAAFLVTMPQVTVFVLAAAFVLSGPYLMLRGERMQVKTPVLHPASSEPKAVTGPSNAQQPAELIEQAAPEKSA